MAAAHKNQRFEPRNWLGLTDSELTQVRIAVNLAVQHFWDDYDGNDERDRKAFNDLLAVQEASNFLMH